MKFYTYWRSTAAYRVRIALNMKNIAVEHVPVDLVRAGGEQLGGAYRAINPNATVPALRLSDGRTITQSLPIIRYLEALEPEPRLIPADPAEAALVESAAQLIASDIHPVNNLRVTSHLKRSFGLAQPAAVDWMNHWMRDGLAAFAALLPAGGPYCFGRTVTLADLCLVPQLYNARRWCLDLSPWPRLAQIEADCHALPAFRDAAPSAQPDAKSDAPAFDLSVPDMSAAERPR